MGFFKSKVGKVVQWFLLLSLSFLFLYFAFRGVKWEDFAQGLKNCNYWWIIASMVVSIVAFVVRALRWRLAMLSISPNITGMEAYRGVTIGYLVNFALPRAGELARCGVISASGKASFEMVLGSVVLERSWDMLSYVVILLGILFLGNNSFGDFVTTQVWSPFVEALPFDFWWALLIIAVLGIFFLYKIYQRREQLSKRPFFAKVFQILSGLWNGLVAGVRMKGKGKFFLWTLALWGCYWLMSLFTIKAFGDIADMNWIDAMFLMVVGSLGWIVPVQGGIGAYHFIISLALAFIYGLPQTSGVIFATISHESQAFTMLLCGIISAVEMAIVKRRTTTKTKNK